MPGVHVALFTTGGEDTWFSNGVTKAGLQILCDGSLRCSHFKDGLDLLKLVRRTPP